MDLCLTSIMETVRVSIESLIWKYEGVPIKIFMPPLVKVFQWRYFSMYSILTFCSKCSSLQ